ncbi:Retrovirus-related Pol polyprotein from transposon TNT 1-94 [Araneus ventricosus]|uniref:Retrovirus-related Pol polyprotein from transposon TNT 1-94 n=1 Tax=Araneus ventricosus TaxID=182803 RepID=A0A4Y2HGZ9_ARAVE|nr:Retrovirus-related Pol polyprotein from transposon TNT 1-94 [Araneus ventricosus]
MAMSSYGAMRIELLTRDNYETWKIQMRALLVKNDLWTYVGGIKVKPELIDGNAESREACSKWTETDEKAKADLILCISPVELKQIKNCVTSRDIWIKLEEIYQSKGPARKATLLKSLIQLKMPDTGDVRDHLRKFFDVVDKLSEMEIKIDENLLSIMLLYSLPASYENFRCAIESRDDLPSADVLRIKIVEESEARRHDSGAQSADSGAFTACHHKRKNASWNSKFKPQKEVDNKFKIKCFKCNKWGDHKAAQCKSQRQSTLGRKQENAGLLTSTKWNKNTADVLLASNKEKRWCLDSGCTRHLSSDESIFVTLDETDVSEVKLANNGTTEVKGCGKAVIKAEVNNNIQTVDVNDALFVPELRTNLLSVAKLCDRGYTVTFKSDVATLINAKAKVKLVADRKDNLYYLRGSDTNQSAKHASESLDTPKTKCADLVKWHCRLGHLNMKDLKESIKRGNIRGLNISKSPVNFDCEICAINKLTRAPFPKKSNRVTSLLEIVHSDLCGPIRVPSIGKSLYFMTFIDEYSRYCVVKFLKTKSDALAAFKEIKCLWENQKSVKIKIFMSDNGGEFINTEFDNFLKTNGIKRRLTAPYCPEQSGIAERKNRSLVEMARCLLSQAKLPLNMWAEAVNTANYLRNRCPTKALSGKTPYELFNEIVPNVSYFKIFGCTAYCLDNKPSHKFSARSKKGIFVGYSENSKAFRIYLPDEKRFLISRSVKFFEDGNINSSIDIGELLIQNKNLNESKMEQEIAEIHSQNEVTEENHNKSSEVATRERNISLLPPVEKNTISLRNREVLRDVESKGSESAEFVYSCNTEIPIKTALSSADAQRWLNALAEELKNILKNETFELVNRPAKKDCIGSRFVLTNKYSPDGSLLKNKARFVARGFSQKPGIDFGETFAPVARQGSIRIMAALSAKLGTEIHQFDVTTAYLNGTLDEEIFMECPAYFKEILEQIIVNEKSNNIALKASNMLKSLNNGDRVLLLNV